MARAITSTLCTGAATHLCGTPTGLASATASCAASGLPHLRRGLISGRRTHRRSPPPHHRPARRHHHASHAPSPRAGRLLQQSARHGWRSTAATRPGLARARVSTIRAERSTTSTSLGRAALPTALNGPICNPRLHHRPARSHLQWTVSLWTCRSDATSAAIIRPCPSAHRACPTCTAAAISGHPTHRQQPHRCHQPRHRLKCRHMR